MASVTKRKLKSGAVVYELRVFRGRDARTGKQLTSFSRRYRPPQDWPEDKAMQRARREAARFEAACRAGRIAPPAEKGTGREVSRLLRHPGDAMTFPAFARVLLNNMAITHAPNTITNYRNVLKRAEREFGDVCVQQIGAEKIQAYLLGLYIERNGRKDAAVSYNTMLKHYMVLHRAFQTAVEMGLLERSPMQGMRKPRPRSGEIIRRPQAYTEQEVRRMIACLEHEPAKWKTLVMVMLDSGCRRGEVLGLILIYV